MQALSASYHQLLHRMVICGDGVSISEERELWPFYFQLNEYYVFCCFVLVC